MKNVDSRRVQTVVRASAFAKKYKLDQPPYGAVVRRIHKAADRLQALAMEQQDAHSAWAGNSHILPDIHGDLRHGHLIKLARTGKRLLKGKPGVEAALDVPDKRTTAEALVAFAGAMATFIEEDAQLFIDEQAPEDFLSRLRAAMKKLEDCQQAIYDSVERQKAATDALRIEVPPAREDVNILDGLLAERLREGGGFAVEWAQAKRVGKRKGQPRHGKWSWRAKKPAKRKRPSRRKKRDPVEGA